MDDQEQGLQDGLADDGYDRWDPDKRVNALDSYPLYDEYQDGWNVVEQEQIE